MGKLFNLAGAFFLSLAGAIMVSPSAHAATLLDVTGTQDDGQSFGPNLVASGAATAFTLNTDVIDFGFSAAIECFGCDGSLYLVRDQIGPGSPVLGLVAIQSIDTSTPVLGFSGLSLSAGTYYALVVVENGFGVWAGPSSPVFAGNGAVSAGANLLATELDGSFAPRSTFVGTSTQFAYSITGRTSLQDSAVPEPSTWAMLLLGFFLVGGQMRRGSSEGRILSVRNPGTAG